MTKRQFKLLGEWAFLALATVGAFTCIIALMISVPKLILVGCLGMLFYGKLALDYTREYLTDFKEAAAK